MVSVFIIIGLALVLGYILGIIGFFQAGAALQEVRQLRQLLAQDIARRAVPPAAPAPTTIASPPLKPIESTSQPAPVAPAPPPAPPPPPPPPAAPTRDHDLESVLTMRWAVGLGAVALLLAGVFLIRYAADQGMLGPSARCWAAALLGTALLAGAEWSRRREVPIVKGRFAVDQAPAALAAGGVSVLFGAAFGAGPFYDLLSPFTAFAAMAACSYLALLASLRFGPLTAAVGIVGAFVSPALVTTASPSLVALFAYLVLTTAAAHAVVRRTAWTWLGWAVTIAGALWILVAGTHPATPGLWAPSLFIALSAILALALPAAAFDDEEGRWLAWGQFLIICATGLVFASMVPDATARAALLSLAPIAIWNAAREPRIDRLPWLAATFGLAALALWRAPGSDVFSTGLTSFEASPLLATAFVFAVAHFAVGSWLETRTPNPARWAALAAATPVLTLALCYAKVGRFEADPLWGLCGLLLAIVLTGAASRAVRQDGRARGGVHATGAIAALALAFAMTMHDQWLTTAFALMLPGIAWVDRKVALPALRLVATIVAGVTFALLANWFLYDLAFHHRTIANNAFVTYAMPALAFFVAGRIFRIGRDDALVALLEAGAIATAACFVTIEIRLWFGHGRLDALAGFDEVTALMLAATAQAFVYDRVAQRAPRPMVLIARGLLGSAAYLTGVGLLIVNPMVTGASVGPISLLFAYLVPGLVSGASSLRTRDPTFRLLLAGYGVAAGFAWITLQVRQIFHPLAMAFSPSSVSDAELWTWSGAWLAYGFAILICGIGIDRRRLRLTGLAIIGVVCLKVFLIDMAALTGLWRVASFLGLGLALIGLGAMHRRFVLPSNRENVAAG